MVSDAVQSQQSGRQRPAILLPEHVRHLQSSDFATLSITTTTTSPRFHSNFRQPNQKPTSEPAGGHEVDFVGTYDFTDARVIGIGGEGLSSQGE